MPEVFLLHRELAAAIGDGREWKAAEVMRSILEYGERNLRRILGASAAAGSGMAGEGRAR